MEEVKLKSFLRQRLDILFVALNPPIQSNENGHYFSGQSSRFFQLLYESGLIKKYVAKEKADEIVFGSTQVNYNSCSYGVIDLVESHIETDSTKVNPTRENSNFLLERIRTHEPRFACVIHSKVRDNLNKHPEITEPLAYGLCGSILKNCNTEFVLNYFPNGNNIPDVEKLRIFHSLKNVL